MHREARGATFLERFGTKIEAVGPGGPTGACVTRRRDAHWPVRLGGLRPRGRDASPCGDGDWPAEGGGEETCTVRFPPSHANHVRCSGWIHFRRSQTYTVITPTKASIRVREEGVEEGWAGVREIPTLRNQRGNVQYFSLPAPPGSRSTTESGKLPVSLS